MEYQILSKEIIYGFCSPIAKGLIIGGSIVLSIKIVLSFIFKFRKVKHCGHCHEMNNCFKA